MVVGIAGLGVIGGSIGLALRSSNHAHVIGYDVDRSVAEEAAHLGCADELAGRVEDIAQADLVLIAVPPHVVRQCLERLEPLLRTGSIVTDCASVKGFVTEWTRKDPSRANWFIGGHPMAGNEGSGPTCADTTLFVGSKWIVTPTGATPETHLNQLESFIHDLGAEPIRMTPEQHDRHVALLSHLPHAIASALVQMSSELETPSVAAGSWRDLTRVAGSNPALWQHILLENRVALIDTLDRFRSNLGELAELLQQGDGEAIQGMLEAARQIKRKQEHAE